MRELVRLEVREIMPEPASVLRHPGMPEPSRLSERVGRLLNEALRLHESLAKPVGVFEEISAREFDLVYKGQGFNPPLSPLPQIYPRAEGLALFAATLGPAVSGQVHDFFEEHDLALGYLLDAVASEAADRLSERLSQRFLARLRARGAALERTRALAYSPGYCGWHVSGQGKLFERLRPEEVGITLNESFLMTPLKSVSGVLLAGPGDIHRFRPDFPFCEACRTHECRWRMASALEDGAAEASHGPSL